MSRLPSVLREIGLIFALVAASLPRSDGLPLHTTDAGLGASLKRFDVLTAQDAQSTPPCTPPAVAIMISGQLQRFIYRDQTGPLLARDPKAKCPPVADVYIALSNASLTQPWSGSVTSTPYFSTASAEAIKEWYLKRGARRVLLKLVDEEELVRAEAAARKAIRDAPEGRQLDNLVGEAYTKDHWFANFRQYYMRHVVYELTLGRSYTALTFWRDDNYFLRPLHIEPMLPKLLTSANAVFVNEFCVFGALSDKIYFFNRGGVDPFFCASFDAFAKKMVAWAAYALASGRRDCPKTTAGAIKCGTHYLQSERWLQHSLMQDRTLVTKWDFHRTEMRYNNGKICASHEYYECTPELGALIASAKVKVCAAKA
jgi:hypothetical protein